MPKFRKRPVVIEANRWHGFQTTTTLNFFKNVHRFDPYGETFPRCQLCGHPSDDHGYIKTLEGGHIVCPGDWIITGVKGEQYPCKPDIFAQTYELVTEDK